DNIEVRDFRADGEIETAGDLRAFLERDPESARQTADVFLLFPADVATFGEPAAISLTDVGFRERTLRGAVQDAVKWLRARRAGLEPAAADALLADVGLEVESLDPGADREAIF